MGFRNARDAFCKLRRLTNRAQRSILHKPGVKLRRSEYASFPAELSVGEYQLGIEERQQQQRQHEAYHVVHEIHVQPSVPDSDKTKG